MSFRRQPFFSPFPDSYWVFIRAFFAAMGQQYSFALKVLHDYAVVLKDLAVLNHESLESKRQWRSRIYLHFLVSIVYVTEFRRVS